MSPTSVFFAGLQSSESVCLEGQGRETLPHMVCAKLQAGFLMIKSYFFFLRSFVNKFVESSTNTCPFQHIFALERWIAAAHLTLFKALPHLLRRLVLKAVGCTGFYLRVSEYGGGNKSTLLYYASTFFQCNRVKLTLHVS